MSGTIVQARESSATAGGADIALAFLSANTAGNNLWVVGHGDNAITPTLTVSDSLSNTYSASLNTITDTDNSNKLDHWQCQNCLSGTPTVTIAFSSTTTFRAILICEISGVINSTPAGNNGQHQLDVGTGTDAISSGTATNATTAFVLGMSARDGGTAGAPVIGTGFTSFLTGWDFGATVNMALEYKANVPPGTNAATFTALAADVDPNTFMIMLTETGSIPPPWRNEVNFIINPYESEDEGRFNELDTRNWW